MAIYLKKFETQAAYEAAHSGLILPNVSLTVDNNTVHYSPSTPVPPTPSHDYVDLGLSVKWATMNVGASSESDNGLYFSWGNTEGHAKDSGYDFSESTYNSTSGSSVSANIAADSGYDAARVNMGGNWRMPTKEECQELYDNCTRTWTSVNGVNGYRMTSNKAGYTSNSIFLPAVGYYIGTTLRDEGSGGHYWSSSFNSSTNAYHLLFYSTFVYPQNDRERYYGRSVRAVTE